MIEWPQRDERFPRLYWFFGSYFHEDWDFDASSPDEVVSAALLETPPEMMGELADEIDLVLNEGLVGELFLYLRTEVHTSFPPGTTPEYHAWLQHMRDGIRSELDG